MAPALLAGGRPNPGHRPQGTPALSRDADRRVHTSRAPQGSRNAAICAQANGLTRAVAGTRSGVRGVARSPRERSGPRCGGRSPQRHQVERGQASPANRRTRRKEPRRPDPCVQPSTRGTERQRRRYRGHKARDTCGATGAVPPAPLSCAGQRRAPLRCRCVAVPSRSAVASQCQCASAFAWQCRCVAVCRCAVGTVAWRFAWQCRVRAWQCGCVAVRLRGSAACLQCRGVAAPGSRVAEVASPCRGCSAGRRGQASFRRRADCIGSPGRPAPVRPGASVVITRHSAGSNACAGIG